MVFRKDGKVEHTAAVLLDKNSKKTKIRVLRDSATHTRILLKLLLWFPAWTIQLQTVRSCILVQIHIQWYEISPE